VIALAHTMSGDQAINVVFHPDRDDFRLENAATRNDRNWCGVAEFGMITRTGNFEVTSTVVERRTSERPASTRYAVVKN
jgi:hypothetical protein